MDTDAQTAKWIATLSDGTTAVEDSGEWIVKANERKPWVRLCQFAAENDLHLTSLRLNFRGKTIHMPRSTFDKFNLGSTNVDPLFYSLQYHVEADDLFGELTSTFFIDLAAHYEDDIAVHYIQDVTDGANSWVVMTNKSEPLAPSPRNLSS